MIELVRSPLPPLLSAVIEGDREGGSVEEGKREGKGEGEEVELSG